MLELLMKKPSLSQLYHYHRRGQKIVYNFHFRKYFLDEHFRGYPFLVKVIFVYLQVYWALFFGKFLCFTSLEIIKMQISRKEIVTIKEVK